jgi:uncharacterized protein
MQRISEIKKIAKKFKNCLEEDNFPVEKILLFGSFATGNYSEDSDIDLCIVSSKWKTEVDPFSGYLWSKSRKIDDRIEPHGFHPDDFEPSNPLVNQIIENGVEII